MKCAWDSLIAILPHWMRQAVDKHGSQTLQELRLRLHQRPELITSTKCIFLDRSVQLEDIQFCINTASRYSPWAAQTISRGYITAPGGHRIGLCGQATVSEGEMVGIRSPNSLCIRISRDFSGIANGTETLTGSVLIIGCPGSGKTTLLRDLIRIRSNTGQGCVSVVDEKGEIFPTSPQGFCFDTGVRTDVLTGCTKAQGIETVLRNMGPSAIAVDEITASEDCEALRRACWCGVDLIATAHAGDKQDFMNRSVYRPLLDSKIFSHLVILRKDKSWYTERMYL